MNKDYGEKIKFSVFFGLLEQGISIVFGFLSTYLTIKYISRDVYGIYNYVLSFMVIINFINIVPANYLFKVKNELENKEELDKFISAFFVFEILKGILIFSLNVFIGFFLYLKFRQTEYLLVAIVNNGILFFINQIISVIRIILNLNFLQKKITKYILISTIIKVMLLYSLYFWQELEIVVFSTLISQTILCIFLYKTLLKNTDFKFTKINKDLIYKKNEESIKSYTLITHLLGVISDVIYRIDPLILGFFVSMTTIGRYSVALNLGNYFMIVFQVLQNNASIALANMNDNLEESKVISRFIIISIVLATFQYVLFIIFGRIFLKIFVETVEIEEIYRYMKYILLGLSFMNSFRVLTSYISLKSNPKILLLNVTIPVAFFSIFTYVTAAISTGANGVAFMNILNYLFFCVLLIRLTKKTNFKFYYK